MSSMLIRLAACAALMLAFVPAAWATCRDAVVLVHGNAGHPGQFDNTYVELRARGWRDDEILRPDWGSKTCAACNDHSGSEEIPVREALVEAIARSCTGRIDVIAHSMGVTLAAKQIVDYGLANAIDTFVGIAGAPRGLRSCGLYPMHVATSTCGAQGLSIGSPLLNHLWGRPLGLRVVSIKSWIDQIVCFGGICTVNGVHASQIPGENASHTHALGHFGLLTDTAIQQADLL
ncbi:alpha/beta fold hydrolase [Luteimonas abyssi]|uniref:alpha/beta fold hydrolase n=1 Tax=Luteimonas abyssi TaxID=1247514 RepID=UPI000737AD96|nr:alpha/beta fold hydrolase [Luteimonas abyssi]